MRFETWPRLLLVLSLLTAAGCYSPPTDYPTRSKEFRFVGWDQSTERLAPTPYRGLLVHTPDGEIGWASVPKGYDWNGDETAFTDAIRFYAPSAENPDGVGRRYLWATVVHGVFEYQVLVGPERGKGEPVSELTFLDWDGKIHTVDLDPAFWRLSTPAKHAPKGK